MITFKQLRTQLNEAKTPEQVLVDVQHHIKTFDKPATPQLLTRKVINSMKEKRNKIKNDIIYNQYQVIIDRLEDELTQLNNKPVNNDVQKNVPKYSSLSIKEKQLILTNILLKLYTQDKLYYSSISQKEIESLVNTPFLDLTAMNIKDLFSNMHTTCIVQDFTMKQRELFGIETEETVRSKLFTTNSQMQSRIILSTNYGLRLLKDAFQILNEKYA